MIEEIILCKMKLWD